MVLFDPFHPVAYSGRPIYSFITGRSKRRQINTRNLSHKELVRGTGSVHYIINVREYKRNRACQLRLVVRQMRCVMRQLRCVMRQLRCVMRQLRCVMRQLRCVMRHMRRVMRQLRRVMRQLRCVMQYGPSCLSFKNRMKLQTFFRL